MENGLKAKIKRDKRGYFLKGNPPGPGRPSGQTLKEYWQQKFRDMTDKEKEKFTNEVGAEAIWRMAEGNPHQSGDVKVELPPKPLDDLRQDNGIQEDKEPQ